MPHQFRAAPVQADAHCSIAYVPRGFPLAKRLKHSEVRRSPPPEDATDQVTLNVRLTGVAALQVVVADLTRGRCRCPGDESDDAAVGATGSADRWCVGGELDRQTTERTARDSSVFSGSPTGGEL